MRAGPPIYLTESQGSDDRRWASLACLFFVIHKGGRAQRQHRSPTNLQLVSTATARLVSIKRKASGAPA